MQRSSFVAVWKGALACFVLARMAGVLFRWGIASLGAWGLGVVQAVEPENPFWFAAVLHLFLDLFAGGWLLMAVLGLACAVTECDESPALRGGFVVLVAGLPVTFLLGVPVDLVPAGLRWLGGGGGVLAGLGRLPWRPGRDTLPGIPL